jgi:hypothetical protein
MSEIPFGIRQQLDAMIRAINGDGKYLSEPPNRGGTDSDELTVFICYLLRRAGAKVRIRVVGSAPDRPPGGEFHHCFSEVFNEKTCEWISLDPHQATKSWAADEIWPIP